MRVVLQLSDPWDMGEALGWPRMPGRVVLESDGSWLVELDDPFRYAGAEYRFVVVSPRHVGVNLGEASRQSVPCNMTRTTSERATSDDPCDVSWWRGGRAMVGSVVAEILAGG